MSDATTYDGLISVLSGLTVIPAGDSDFQNELPDTISYANNRMCRDLDFLITRSQFAATLLTAGATFFTLGALAKQIVVVETVGLLGTFLPSGQIVYPLVRQSLPYMQTMYPLTSVVPPAGTIPVDFCPLNLGTGIDSDVYVGPAPSIPYTPIVTGTVRPAPPSSTNENPWILANLPDLFVTACMVRLSGYMKNYGGAASDDPQQPVSWEAQYQALLKGAAVEEARRKGQSASWSDQKPLVESTPPRQ